MEKYLIHLAWVVFILSISSKCKADDPPFPKISDFDYEYYETEVQITDIEQQASAFAKEYHDDGEKRGRVDVLIFGDKRSIFYYNDTGEILDVTSTTCEAWKTDESKYFQEEMFYGWLNTDPVIIGPSASLWYAEGNYDKITYDGQETVRGIKCDKYKLPIKDDRNDMLLTYYFADKAWTTPYQVGFLRVPIRVTAVGDSSRDTSKPEDFIPVNQVTDFAYFRPTIERWYRLAPDIGIGCQWKEPTRKVPKIPNEFQYFAETYDFAKAAKDSSTVDINFIAVYYDYGAKMARMDEYTRAGYTSELQDFNTGVTYKVTNGEKCVIKPIRFSYFASYGHLAMGHMKEPAELFLLDEEVYYMGTREYRSIAVDVFERVMFHESFMDTEFYKLVITAYFTQADNIEISMSGETESQILIYYLVTGWDTPTQVTLKKQFNVFGFNDAIIPPMYQSVDISNCFPASIEKSYFMLSFLVPIKLGAIMEEQDSVFREKLKEFISVQTDVSLMRIPLLSADYTSSGVFVTGIMLERPPALKQFWSLPLAYVHVHDKHFKTLGVKTPEQCAYACVGEEKFDCTGFYMCNGDCFLKSKDILEEPDESDPGYDPGECESYVRAVRDSNNNEDYLGEALMQLDSLVGEGKFKIDLEIDIKEDGKVLEGHKDIIADDITIGGGPDSGDDDKPYELVVKFETLVKEEATEIVDYIDTLYDCYKACKDSKNMACSSFSYCADSSVKNCRITSNLFVDRKSNIDSTDPNKDCHIYSLKYLAYYKPYPGKVVHISGEDSFDGITVEECAKNCRLEDNFLCRGFEYCKSGKSCTLHSKHVLDLNKAQVTDQKNKKDQKCIHYAAKFSADYDDLGETIIVDDSNKRTNVDLENCSRACSVEMASCKSFNYCPPTNEFAGDSSCSLLTTTLVDKNIKTDVSDVCHHYEKKNKVEDWGKSKKLQSSSGYTSKAFSGMVVGLLALGLVIGAVLFVLYSYIKSRRSDSGMTVRFMKQDM